ncbi:MAG: DUF2442 domain-containing protein [Planctomycetota bacterium]
MRTSARTIRVERVALIGPFSLELTFNDGTTRRANLWDELTGPVFEPLRDPGFFSRVMLDPVAGTVVWPNGADFAPDFLRALPQEAAGPKRRRSAKAALPRPHRSAARR